MRCALIIPAWRPEDLFPATTARLQVNYWQPLGLLSLAAVLERAGHEVRLFDGAFLGHQELLAAVAAWGPRLAGIQSNTFLWNRAARTARDLKALDAGIFTCAGGPHPTALAGPCLADCPELDAVAVGEGEQTIVELAGALAAGDSLEGIAGLAWRAGDGIRLNPPRPLLEDLDALPFPARRLLGDPGQYLPPPGTFRASPVATLMTSRGCANRCVYCFQMDPERRVRFRSIPNVLDEIEDVLAQGYREVRFLDDTLTVDRGRALALCAGIQARGLDFPWFASACVQQVDPELLKAMRAAGCWSILLGAESGVQANLNALRKGSTPAQISQAVAWAKQAGLHVVTPFLLGIPGQTRADALATIAFAAKLDPDVASFHLLAPFPGTELYQTAAQWGELSPRWEDYTFQGMAFVPFGLSRNGLAELRSLAFRAFYTRPRLMLRRAAAVRSLADLKNLLLAAKGLFGLWAHKDLFQRRGAP